MKNQKQFYLSIFFIKVFLLASANAFAFSPSSVSQGSTSSKFLKLEQNKKAVQFEENISHSRIEISLENEKNLLSIHWKNTPEVGLRGSFSENLQTSAFLPDRKEQLKRQIFPFHYFW